MAVRNPVRAVALYAQAGSVDRLLVGLQVVGPGRDGGHRYAGHAGRVHRQERDERQRDGGDHRRGPGRRHVEQGARRGTQPDHRAAGRGAEQRGVAPLVATVSTAE